jgi:hypothetical protein
MLTITPWRMSLRGIMINLNEFQLAYRELVKLSSSEETAGRK